MTPASAVGLFAIAALISGVLTALARRYALRRRLLDMPGKRRSHATVTPRGGGISPVATTLIGSALLLAMHPAAHAFGMCLLAMAAVAAMGWVDDHRHLSVWLRLTAHVAAASIAAIALLGIPQTAQEGLLLALAVFWIVSLVNAWNFMDGIDGLATTQAALATGCTLVGGLLYGWLDQPWDAFALLFIGALFGFLPFNFPRAKIFLGDVGSGALGFVIACLLLHAVAGGKLSWPLALLPVSAFVVDAGLTLSKRIANGKKWWRPHREHLYQWLVRRGHSHARITFAYGLWTLAACVVALVCADSTIGVSTLFSVAALLLALVLWNCIRKHLWINARKSSAEAERR